MYRAGILLKNIKLPARNDIFRYISSSKEGDDDPTPNRLMVSTFCVVYGTRLGYPTSLSRPIFFLTAALD